MHAAGMRAGEWQCRNPDTEIVCTPDKCAASESFTSVHVSVDDRGTMSVCAYSGCYSGTARVFRSGAHVHASGHALAWNGNAAGRADFLVGIDTGDNLAVLKGHGYAMPLRCMSGAGAP